MMETAMKSAFALKDSVTDGSQFEFIHRFGKSEKHICRTDGVGHSTPDGLSVTELRVDTHLGFVPLWAKGVTLRWRFQTASLAVFKNPEAAKTGIRAMMATALAGWGDAQPVGFTEQRDNVDFEVVIRPNADCDATGCVLASAFFPDAGRHEFIIYPTFFQQSKAEQVETLQHEFGHVFGLRHWFANISEQEWSSTLFGSGSRFTIMNYGKDSKLTKRDRSDLKALYAGAWSGTLTTINGTPVRLQQPYHTQL
jgi:Matrixin